jgi:ElaB/YqjD/DUF883 family membrane-anchored ribosome-binding protein
MDIINRLGQAGSPGGSIPWDNALISAAALAHNAGKRLAEGRRWVETESMEQRPLTTLGVAFALGVFTGWLIKRR